MSAFAREASGTTVPNESYPHGARDSRSRGGGGCETTIEQRTNELHVAAVFAHDGIRLLTVAPSEEAVRERLAAYIEGQADILLWPADARQVRALLDVGEKEEAIALYFARVGERWEREHLHRGDPV